MEKIVMLIVFRLKEGVSDRDFLAASDAIQREHVSKCPGYVSRRLFCEGGEWFDEVVWQTQADAEAAMHSGGELPEVTAFLSLIGEVSREVIVPLLRGYDRGGG